ncbi:MAG: hydroxyethylthiazole kinase [Chloroflexi bacterium AL-W]|nr:hydroxyethylthiazole kinase [Chloroflexi bacterium AL-N1]NOK71674.1 hydroxyethylthiazole kinase [Chloroflexi bacterium AL-N10]NOK79015.1 hydroxyethylthiazole kinase [Chloroflexi bacterium AL-N5]NOK86449.1 hydroxyethylthiazole kinase [Chloroflexi bacterium AL-W]NOK93415.1 hydroxyethylthiazole kinase [Chloroflexi bacterium AL-N15]
MDLKERTAQNLVRIRAEKPLLHHLINFVVMNDTANVTLHIGALPVMAHAAEEVAEMVDAAGALILNMGTLTNEWIEAMTIAGQRANATQTPIVLDPVGAGATTLRTTTNKAFLHDLKIAIVRGNAGELSALTGLEGEVRGVESIASHDDPVVVAQQMARTYRTVAALTGKRDIVADGERVFGVDNGHSWLPSLTGTGCMATTVVAAFAAVESDPLVAAAGGLATYGLAAELAADKATGPASFKVAFFDQIYHLTPEQVFESVRIVAIDP